jgi:hypothetical protein
VFLVFLVAGAANLATGGGELFRKLTPFLVATVPVLVGLGLMRAIALLRRGTGASWRDAIGGDSIRLSSPGNPLSLEPPRSVRSAGRGKKTGRGRPAARP